MNYIGNGRARTVLFEWDIYIPNEKVIKVDLTLFVDLQVYLDAIQRDMDLFVDEPIVKRRIHENPGLYKKPKRN